MATKPRTVTKRASAPVFVGHKHPAPVCINVVRAALGEVQLPSPPTLRFARMQRKAGSGAHHITDGVVWVQASWRTSRGVQQHADIPVAIVDSYALPPELLIHDGQLRVIAQSSIDDITARATTFARDNDREHMYSAPPPRDQAPGAPKPQIGLGLFGRTAVHNKLAVITHEHGKWLVKSHDGKVLGTHDTEAAALAQLRAIEISKHGQAMPVYTPPPQKQEVAPPPSKGAPHPDKGTDLPPLKPLPPESQSTQFRGAPEPTRVVYDQLKLKPYGGYDNIKAILQHATPEEIGFYRRWYKQAHGDIQRLAKHYNKPVDVVAGVVAAVSPNMPWDRNLANARRILEGETRTEAWPINTNKALYVLRTGDTTPLKRGDWGPKVGPFFESLLSPWDQHHRAVIDGHAANIWYGSFKPLAGRKGKDKLQDGSESSSIKGATPTDKQRAEMMNDYARAGADLKLSAQEAQAVTWTLWRQMVNAKRAEEEAQAEQKKQGQKGQPGTLVHYSKTPGLNALDPSNIGKGHLSGPERQDTRVPVTFYYFEGTEPEHLITSQSNARYEAELPTDAKLLDLAQMPDWARAAYREDGRGGMYKAIKDRGYFGFYNTASGLPNAVAVFYTLAVRETPFR